MICQRYLSHTCTCTAHKYIAQMLTWAVVSVARFCLIGRSVTECASMKWSIAVTCSEPASTTTTDRALAPVGPQVPRSIHCRGRNIRQLLQRVFVVFIYLYNAHDNVLMLTQYKSEVQTLIWYIPFTVEPIAKMLKI